MPLQTPGSSSSHATSIGTEARLRLSRWSSRRVGFIVAAAFLLPSLATIWNLHQRSRQFLIEDMKGDLSIAARAMAAAIDPALQGTFHDRTQEKSDAYVAEIGKLTRTRSIVDPKGMIKFVYTCVEKGNDIYFVLDDTPEGDADHDGVDDKAHIMEPYKEASDTLRHVFKTGRAEVSDTPYQDKWGRFISGNAPIFDAQHHLVAVVGVDLAMVDYEMKLSGLRMVSGLSAIGAAGLAFIVGIGAAYYQRRLQKTVGELVAMGEVAMAASKAKSDFLGTMSHELRTPMNAIIGHVNLLKDHRLSSEQEDSLSTVQKAAESLNTMLKDILDYASIDATNLVLERKPVVLAGLFDEIRADFGPAAVAKGLTLRVSLDQTCPERIQGDRDQLARMLRHLVANAVKFSERGTITLSARVEEEMLHFSVSDEGIGITEELQSRLFSVFGLGDASSTREQGGTGIGLALCKRICEAMKGRIWVVSETGKGSTFHVMVPVATMPSSGEVWLVTENNLTTIMVKGVVEKMRRKLHVVSLGSETKVGPNDIILWDTGTPWANEMRGKRVIALDAGHDELPDDLFQSVIDSPIKPAKLREVLESL